MLHQKPSFTEKQAEQLGAEIIKALTPTSESITEITASPFLFSRIKANIAAEVAERETAGNFWFGLFRGLRIALPAFALLAVFALGGAVYLGKEANTSNAITALPPTSSIESLVYDNSDDLYALEDGLTEVK